jgi:opacity protein-like surface antigen
MASLLKRTSSRFWKDCAMREPFVFAVTAACLLFVSYPAHAADPGRMEVSGGVDFLGDVGGSENYFGGLLNGGGGQFQQFGWAVSVGSYFKDWFAIVAEAGGSYTSRNIGGAVVGGTDYRVKEYSFMAGPKLALRPNPQVTPFLQILFGRVNASASGPVSASQSDFGVQPGGGVDVTVKPSLAVRVQSDYRTARLSNGLDNNFRFVVGIVFRK